MVGGTGGQPEGGVSGQPEAGDGGQSGAGAATGGAANGGTAAGGAATSGAGAGGAGAGGVSSKIPVGALVTRESHNCLAVARASGSVVNDADVVLRSCTDDPSQRWSTDAEGHLVASGLADAFLTSEDVAAGLGGQGGASFWVSAAVEPAVAQQQWSFENISLANDVGLCVDVPWGEFKAEAPVQLWVCHYEAPQQWTLDPTGLIRHGEYCIDIPHGDTTDGTLIELWYCKDPPEENQQFVLDHGRIRTYDGKCIGTAGDPSAKETRLEVVPCEMPTDTRPPGVSFRVTGTVMNQGACLDAGIGATGVSNQLALNPCDANAGGQFWNYFF
jgi:hypothetical protein